MSNNEAPMSVTTQAYYKGFSLLITQRTSDVDVKKLVKEQMEVIDWLIAQGLKPSWNDDTNAKHTGTVHTPKAQENPYTENNNTACEVCGQPAIEKKGITKAGKAYHGIFCSTDDRSHTRWLWN